MLGVAITSSLQGKEGYVGCLFILSALLSLLFSEELMYTCMHAHAPACTHTQTLIHFKKKKKMKVCHVFNVCVSVCECMRLWVVVFYCQECLGRIELLLLGGGHHKVPAPTHILMYSLSSFDFLLGCVALHD